MSRSKGMGEANPLSRGGEWLLEAGLSRSKGMGEASPLSRGGEWL